MTKRKDNRDVLLVVGLFSGIISLAAFIYMIGWIVMKAPMAGLVVIGIVSGFISLVCIGLYSDI